MIGKFDIHITGHKDYLYWSTSFEDGSQFGDASVEYVNQVAVELARAIEKLQELTPQKTADKA